MQAGRIHSNENLISSIERRQENNEDSKNKESSKNGHKESNGKGRQAEKEYFYY